MIRITREARAKSLRFHQTRAERRFARMVKEAFPHTTLKQQAVIGPYIVDFLLPDHNMIVEIDGGHHEGSAQDKKRDAWLTKKGYKVIRFWNNDIMKRIEGCYIILENSLSQT